MAKNKDITTSHLSRRTVVKGAAWSVPVIAVAAAAPAAAASEASTVSNFSVDGTCGTGALGLIGAGFTVTADPATPIPAGSQLVISGSGINVSALSFSLGSLASVASIAISGSNQVITFNSDYSGTGSVTATLSISVASTMTASLTMPSGYTAGTNTKSSGSLNIPLIVGCSAT